MVKFIFQKVPYGYRAEKLRWGQNAGRSGQGRKK